MDAEYGGWEGRMGGDGRRGWEEEGRRRGWEDDACFFHYVMIVMVRFKVMMEEVCSLDRKVDRKVARTEK